MMDSLRTATNLIASAAPTRNGADLLFVPAGELRGSQVGLQNPRLDVVLCEHEHLTFLAGLEVALVDHVTDRDLLFVADRDRERLVRFDLGILVEVADETDDQALAFLKSSYRAELKRAFTAELPKRARTVLRLQVSAYPRTSSAS